MRLKHILYSFLINIIAGIIEVLVDSVVKRFIGKLAVLIKKFNIFRKSYIVLPEFDLLIEFIAYML